MNLNPKHGIAVFTDGSAHAKDRSGGWAWIAIDAFDGIQTDSGYRSDTTIGQMELEAVAQALNTLAEEYQAQTVLVHCDSEYVVLGCKDRTRKRNKNHKWWKRVDTGINRHHYVEFEHIYGHRGHEFNEKADELAGLARKKGKLSEHNTEGSST